MRHSNTTYATSGSRAKATSIAKSRAQQATKRTYNLRSLDRYFWYKTADGVSHCARNTGVSSTSPQQLNSYEINTSSFVHEPLPANFPSSSAWPPKQPQDLVTTISTSKYVIPCAGNASYATTTCTNVHCSHTLEAFESTQDWHSHFELRHTATRGIGIVTKRAFRKGTVLGWYCGSLVALSTPPNSDYLMELPVGAIESRFLDDHYAVFIDASEKGNWTRFINHACDAYAVFRNMRVGKTFIVAVKATRDVPKGVELTVDYGNQYYGIDSARSCCCGAVNCVSKKREPEEQALARETGISTKESAGFEQTGVRAREGRLDYAAAFGMQ